MISADVWQMFRPALIPLFAACLGLVPALQPAWAMQIQPEALSYLPHAQVVILGETHDNPIHHENQARAIAAIKPKALVFEMVGRSHSAGVPLTDKAQMFGQGWDADFYLPLIEAAPQAILYGAEIPREIARLAMEKGVDVVFGAEDQALYGLDQALAFDAQKQRESSIQSAHCNALPEEILPAMVTAQRLRDAELARVTLRALAETGGPVVVVTGQAHARRDEGMSVYLGKAAPEVTILSVGQFEEPPEEEDKAAVAFDLWLVTDPVLGREDPCAAFEQTSADDADLAEGAEQVEPGPEPGPMPQPATEAEATAQN